jgi:hypothetical protein
METMTPSTESTATTTDGQISKAVSNYRALIEKHAPEFNSESVQKGLGHPNLAGEMLAVFRKYADMFANLITRVVKGINRTITPKQVLDATGRTQYTDKDVVASMPRGQGEDKEVVFFKLSRSISDEDLEKEYALRGLKPADPYSLAKVNQDDPAFADANPNSTHWKDENGKWCYAAFIQWNDGERCVDVDRRDIGWNDSWWFAGVRE